MEGSKQRRHYRQKPKEKRNQGSGLLKRSLLMGSDGKVSIPH